jgi:D-xylose transport system permease protein
MSSDFTDLHEERSTPAPGASAVAAEPAPTTEEATLVPSVGQLFRGDLGMLPVLVALVLIAAFFQIVSPGHLFLSPRNLTELVGQIITIGTLSLGAVLVMLVGEIDLSLAVVSALCGGIMGVLSARMGLPAPAAILGGLLAGAIIGTLNGFFVAVARMPSFIVTLAGLIGFQGLLLRILEPQTTLPIHDNFINAISVTYLPDWLGVGLPVAGLVIYAAGLIYERIQRQRFGLAVQPIGRLALQIGGVSLLVVLVLALFESYQGVLLPAMILLGLIVLFWLITRRTAFGRHIYAVGGNAEAARRAGINVTGLRVSLFALASTLAAIGGMLEASREFSAPAAPESTLLLDAIAAAVIGGVSLFGGRGSVWAVVLGSLIVGSLENGLDLIGQPAATKLMVEGAVLLIAVLADAVLRRRSATGLR